MKKTICCVLVFCVWGILISCVGNAAGTPPPEPTHTPNPPTPTQGVSLDDFPDKVFVGENGSYAIYLIHRSGGTDDLPTGELLVFDKDADLVMPMNGSFTVLIGGGTIVNDDGKEEYLVLSMGTYVLRKAVVLSLKDRRQAVNEFCLSAGPYGEHLFWNNYIIFNNCDTSPNRPWGAGEAPGIAAIDLATGAGTTIAQSDLTHQFQIQRIEGDILRYVETYVENEADWQSADKQMTKEDTYDLSLLNANN
jgi:hypothetical protein